MRLQTCLIATGSLLIVGPSCQRDQVAPDCFVREDGQCVVADPTTPGMLSVECGTPPLGAVGANYNHAVTFDGPATVSFSATNLPPGLQMAPSTGEINGKPLEVGTTSDVVVTITDDSTGESEVSTCGPIKIDPALDHDLFDLPADAPLGCLPMGTDLDDHLMGGDGSTRTCAYTPAASGGEGNGDLPSGITFEASTCSASGTIDDDHVGTFVWVVEVEQSGYTIHVPFCATAPVDQAFHDIDVTLASASHDPLAPGIITFDPEAALVFGDGDDPRFEITEACNGGSCNNFGFKFTVNASPFDVPFSLETSGPIDDGMGKNIGFFHGVQLSTQGKPTGGQTNGGRTWVANLRMSYCTASNSMDCDPDIDGNVEANAQTRYTWSVIAHPQ